MAGTTVIKIPKGFPSIGARAFKNRADLMEVIIPQGIKHIYEEAFANCANLTCVTVPGSINLLARSAFNNCPNLLCVTVEKPSILTLEQLHECFDFDNIGPAGTIKGFGLNGEVIPDSLCHLALWLKKANIPDGVKTIGQNAFFCCENLTELTIPNSVKVIESGAFYMCKRLTKIVIPNSVERIEILAFSGCRNLDIIIPPNVSCIGPEAFENVSHITYHGSLPGAPWGARSMN